MGTERETTSSEADTSQNQGQVPRADLKRAALEEKKSDSPKKRAVLRDVTNVEHIKKEQAGSSKVVSSVTSKATDVKVEVVSNSAGNLSPCTNTTSLGANDASYRPSRGLGRSASSDKVATECFGGASIESSSPKCIDISSDDSSSKCVDIDSDDSSAKCVDIDSDDSSAKCVDIDSDDSIQTCVDIDSDDRDPLLCSLYAPEIYDNYFAAELKRRPFPGFVERIQKNLTPKSRAMLVNWLVEVSEQLALVPDTLYHTVYLIDRFLSGNFIDRQRLQLLGLTCIYIASKYEEFRCPHLDQFFFNGCTRNQVLEMEREVLKYFSFQIYTPTAKTFLRRFLRAAQASQQNPSLEIQSLAYYLTELTLMDYRFVMFLPSIIAASAVFLAKWTLNQSSHPWNQTLEHYTTYNASDLETPVHALQDLQLNAKDSSFDLISRKYSQAKFQSVAVLTSPEIPDSLFERA